MTSIWVSYAVACAVCIALSVQFAVTRVNSRTARRVSAAAAITAIWAAAISIGTVSGVVPAGLIAALDAARYGSWFYAAAAIGAVPLVPWLARAALAVWSGLLLIIVCLPQLEVRAAGSPTHLGSMGTLAPLLMALLGIVLTEQVLRNTPVERRAAMRLAAIGVGGQYAYDLFVYAQSQLLGGVDSVPWLGRGLATAVLMPFIFLAMRRLGTRSAELYISRHVVFYTGALVAVGGYLCVMALGGYYVRMRGGTWGELLQLLFLFGAILALASLLFTESWWRRFRVFIATHFYRTKYDYRVEWLRFAGTLSTRGEADTPSTAIKAVAQIFGVRHGTIYMRDGNGQRFVRAASWSSAQQPVVAEGNLNCDTGLIHLLQKRQWVIDLQEYRLAPSAYAKARVPHWLEVQTGWRLLVPLLDVDRLVAILLLGEPPAPFEMAFEDRDLLKTVGRHVAVHLSQHEADSRLAESRQFDAYNRFAAFVMHDLKNAVAQLQLLVGNAARHRGNPQFFDDAISTISNTVARMTRLIEQLQTRDVQAQAREILLVPLLETSIARCRVREPQPKLECMAADLRVHGDPEKLGVVLEHIIRNAQEATGEHGEVTVRLHTDSGRAVVQIVDDGPGMEPEFVRERLFKPFDSTKGSKGMGIGAYQARDYVRHMGGDVEVQSSAGRGTNFNITLPLCQTINRVS